MAGFSASVPEGLIALHCAVRFAIRSGVSTFPRRRIRVAFVVLLCFRLFPAGARKGLFMCTKLKSASSNANLALSALHQFDGRMLNACKISDRNTLNNMHCLKVFENVTRSWLYRNFVFSGSRGRDVIGGGGRVGARWRLF